MEKPGFAKSFTDLIVYKKAQEVATAVFGLSRTFPKEETYSLTDQIRRSSRSIGAQIAEAWAKRRYEKHFVSKLTDSDGEQQETQHWLLSALQCGYITNDQATVLLQKLSEIGKMLNKMMQKAYLFCQEDQRSVREEMTDYASDSEDFFYSGH